jgi:hypothetical protein
VLRMEHNNHDVEVIIDTVSMISIMSWGHYEQYFSYATIDTTIHARLHNANKGSRPFYGLLLNVVSLCGGAKTMANVYDVDHQYNDGGDRKTYTQDPNFHFILGIKWMEKNLVSVMMINGKQYTQCAFPHLGKTVQVLLIKPTEIKYLKKGACIENIYPDVEPKGYMVKIKSKEIYDLEGEHYMIALTFENDKDESRKNATAPGVNSCKRIATLLTSLATSHHSQDVTPGATLPMLTSSLFLQHPKSQLPSSPIGELRTSHINLKIA